MLRRSIFISYAREDMALARKIYNDLKNEGLDPWLDSECLLPGERWKVAISQAIKNSRYFLALLSSNSVNREGFVQKEIREALTILDNFPEDAIFVIPARLDNCRPSHTMLHELNWVDMFPDWEPGIKKIINAVLKDKADIELTHLKQIVDNEIKKYVNQERPFGPISTDVIENQKVRDLLFDGQNRIYRKLSGTPAFIFGRKGSGKTAFLRNLGVNRKYGVVSEIRTSNAFIEVLKTIESLSSRLMFVEAIADVWEVLAWHAVFVEITKDSSHSSSESDIIRSYLSKAGDYVSNPGQLALSVAQQVRIVCNQPTDPGSKCMEQIYFGETTYGKAKSAAIDILESRRSKAIILMDSMENFALDSDTVSFALSGLFKCIGRMHSPECYCEISFCFPSELWSVLSKLSTNPLKDFEHQVRLHWHAGELLSIAAHRLRIYLLEYEPTFCETKGFSNFNLDDRKEAQALFDLVFPKEITNSRKMREATIAYIWRHTQLLPRQLLAYLNAIVKRNSDKGGSIVNITEEAVIDGVQSKEGDIANEILSAYGFVHPHAGAVCAACIPELPLSFSTGQLHRVFNRHGKKHFGSNDFEEFRGMLIEIGCVGRVIETESDRYIKGEFEYTVPNKLIVGTGDELCLHPVFTKAFSAGRRDNRCKTVYPYGSHVDEIDYRD